MLTLFVLGYLAYMVIGIGLIGGLLYKYLNENYCQECWHFILGFFWTFLPFTLLYDFTH